MGVVWQFALVSVLLIGLIYFVKYSSKYEAKMRKTNTAVNNTIADLIENKSLIYVSTDGLYPDVRIGNTNSVNAYADLVISLGFKGNTILSVKEFHENLYLGHDELVQLLDNAVSFQHVDATTTPVKRMENNEDVKNILPFLMLGDIHGDGSEPKNSKYINDESYAGYINTEADYFMNPM